MKEQQQPTQQVVYIVTCYQNIVGVYANQDDANIAARDLILKGRPADVLCRLIVQPVKTA